MALFLEGIKYEMRVSTLVRDICPLIRNKSKIPHTVLECIYL